MDPAITKVSNWAEVPHFVNKNGQHLYCRYWSPESTANLKGLVFISHGVGEHCGWYDGIAELLVKNNFLVCGHDHVGNGLSEGDRVHITNFDFYIQDLMQHVDMMKDKHGDLPIFVIGHSMGGAVAIKAGLDHPDAFKGIVLIAPAIAANAESATTVKVYAARLMSWMAPQFQVGKIDSSWICQDKDMVTRYNNDPLVWHGGLKARWAVCMLDIFTEIQARLGEITWPFLLLHGTVDKMCAIEGSEMMDKRAKSTRKTYKVYEGGYHQLHNEPDGVGEGCRNLISEWIDETYKIQAKT